VIDAAIAHQAARILVAPCCYSDQLAFGAAANRWSETLGVPAQAEVRRRFFNAMVDAERTLRLERSGYETVVVPFVAPTVTPHNLLFRARKMGESRRMASAQERWERLHK
jgi:hypothetical protein